MTSNLFQLNSKDFLKGLVMAVLTGVLLPVAAAIQTPGFDLATANWNAILQLAINGAGVGFLSYIGKNFFSDESGRFMGRVG